jgi:hypothetical protein
MLVLFSQSAAYGSFGRSNYMMPFWAPHYRGGYAESGEFPDPMPDQSWVPPLVRGMGNHNQLYEDYVTAHVRVGIHLDLIILLRYNML